MTPHMRRFREPVRQPLWPFARLHSNIAGHWNGTHPKPVCRQRSYRDAGGRSCAPRWPSVRQGAAMYRRPPPPPGSGRMAAKALEARLPTPAGNPGDRPIHSRLASGPQSNLACAPRRPRLRPSAQPTYACGLNQLQSVGLDIPEETWLLNHPPRSLRRLKLNGMARANELQRQSPHGTRPWPMAGLCSRDASRTPITGLNCACDSAIPNVPALLTGAMNRSPSRMSTTRWASPDASQSPHPATGALQNGQTEPDRHGSLRRRQINGSPETGRTLPPPRRLLNGSTTLTPCIWPSSKQGADAGRYPMPVPSLAGTHPRSHRGGSATRPQGNRRDRYHAAMADHAN